MSALTNVLRVVLRGVNLNGGNAEELERAVQDVERSQAEVSNMLGRMWQVVQEHERILRPPPPAPTAQLAIHESEPETQPGY